MIQQIPKTKEAVFHCLGLVPHLTTRICCQKCFALYPLQPDNPNAPTKCKQSFLSQYQGYCKWAKLQKLDPTCDQELYKLDKRKVSTPIRTYTYVTLYSWLEERVAQPSFESLLDSSLSATSWESDDPMEDVWHGSVWREFPNADDGSGIYTSHSGNLVFSLSLDWFNAEGSSSHGKHNSVGAIVLICLNLPPTQRYKVKNVFLFGIIPGPREPSLDEVNHLLQPLIDELKEFWTGIFFASTSQHPQGRTIRAAIFPLIADLPALRKVGGFGSHSSIRFCSFCTLSKHNLEEINKLKFHPRTNDEHLKQANAWLQHDNATSRKKFSNNTVRDGVFSMSCHTGSPSNFAQLN